MFPPEKAFLCFSLSSLKGFFAAFSSVFFVAFQGVERAAKNLDKSHIFKSGIIGTGVTRSQSVSI